MTNEMEVAELREALEARGLDSSGLKPALVARLQASLDHQDQCDQKVPSPASSTDEEQPPAEEEPEKNDKGSTLRAGARGQRQARGSHGPRTTRRALVSTSTHTTLDPKPHRAGPVPAPQPPARRGGRCRVRYRAPRRESAMALSLEELSPLSKMSLYFDARGKAVF